MEEVFSISVGSSACSVEELGAAEFHVALSVSDEAWEKYLVEAGVVDERKCATLAKLAWRLAMLLESTYHVNAVCIIGY